MPDGRVEVSLNGMSAYEGTPTLTIEQGKSATYYIRLSAEPTPNPTDGFDRSDSRFDEWWVTIQIDDSRRMDGYDRDGDQKTDITLRPNLGRVFNKSSGDWDDWKNVQIIVGNDAPTGKISTTKFGTTTLTAQYTT